MERLRCWRTLAAVSLGWLLVFNVTARGQEPPANPYAEWSDIKLKRELDLLRKKFAAHHNDEKAPESWKKMLAASEARAQVDVKWSEEQRRKSEEYEKLKRDPHAKRWSQELERIQAEISLLDREHYRRIWQSGHQRTLARHAELAKRPLPETPKLRALELDVLHFPKMDGSTSTQPLGVLVACKCFQIPFKWVWKYEPYEEVKLEPLTSFTPNLDIDDGIRKPEPEFQLFEYALRADARSRPEERLAAIINSLLVTNASTHDAYLNLIEGKSDLGLIARGPSMRELEEARAKGVELEVVPIALDALVFIVNERQGVRSLTTSQIKEVYQGKIRKWDSLGGGDAVINAYQRPEDSGSQELMRELVMKGEEMAPAQVRLLGRMMSSVYLNLTKDELGLAYSVHYYEQYMIGSGATQSIAVDGVKPSFETIQNGTYPHVCSVYAALRKGEPDASPARKLRDWLLTEEGQEVVRDSGYVPLGSRSR